MVADSTIARLVGDGGLTPAALLEIVKRNHRPDAPDDGLEPMVVTTMVFRIGDYRSTLRALRIVEGQAVVTPIRRVSE